MPTGVRRTRCGMSGILTDIVLVPLIGAPHFLHDVVLKGFTQLSVPQLPHLIFSLAIARHPLFVMMKHLTIRHYYSLLM